MKLNPDCIRDILLQVESKVDSEICCIQFQDLVEYLCDYDRNTLHYHVNQISKSKLVDDVYYSEDEPECISDLSPEGHEFLANIRSNSNWNKTKDIAKNIGSNSLNTLKEISIVVISELIKKQFT